MIGPDGVKTMSHDAVLVIVPRITLDITLDVMKDTRVDLLFEFCDKVPSLQWLMKVVYRMTKKGKVTYEYSYNEYDMSILYYKFEKQLKRAIEE